MPDFTASTKSGTFSIDPISVSIRITCSLAPPWRGPYRAAHAADAAVYGSACEEPTTRIAVVEQFCSWSAWRMNNTSSALARIGLSKKYFSSGLNIMFMKFAVKLRLLSGYTNGMPALNRWQHAASVGILATRRTISTWRCVSSSIFLASR